MKHKITRRLIGYFSAVLLFFSIIAGVMFFFLFTKHTTDLHEKELVKRAVSIADTLSQFLNQKAYGRRQGYGAYLRFIDDIAMSEVWLVDNQANILQTGHMKSTFSYEQLPDGAEKLIQEVFQGSVAVNKEFSSILDTPSVTVGAPLTDAEGAVFAVLLLHSPVEGIGQAQHDGIVILLFCILSALILAAALSVLLAHHFIEPLKKMAATAEKITLGDYSAHTGVMQNDEIGALANDIDNLSVMLSKAESERAQLEKMRKEFAMNISHELRTPVTVVKGSLEVLNEGLIKNPLEMQEYFRQMLTDINHLDRLVNDSLEFSRLQNTSFQIEKTELNLSELITEAIRSMNQISAQKQVTIKITSDTDAFCFFGDYGRLRQMFIIILDNAVKFSPCNDTVEVNIENHSTDYTVTISDHGKGISHEDIPYIFDHLYREHSEQNKTGNGLGLSIAKQIADRHGITIQCFSKPFESTSFSFLFPANHKMEC